MKVLSLFDGMSCGRIALERAGISVKQYFASEIEKRPIFIAQKNYPTTIQLGDVRIVREMAQHGLLGHIDILMGGSPCQGFSFAGDQLAFDDPRSALFFEYVWILKALQQINPNIKFLLENVKMKKEHLKVISDLLGVQPVLINSALVSAQNRNRYYWANWKISQPMDGGVLLRDILEHEVDEKYIISEKNKKRLFESSDLKKQFSVIDPQKAICMTARQYANWKGTYVTAINYSSSGRGNKKVEKRMYDSADKKALTLLATGYGTRQFTGVITDNCDIRQLTPIECERLQTVPDNYTDGVSDNQRYKMLGNGWTVDVIAHIFREMPR